MYAGRASASPYIDLFITLLSMGLNGYKNLLEERKRLIPLFEQGLAAVAKKHGERLLMCPRNTISFGITLNGLGLFEAEDGKQPSDEERNARVGLEISHFGSMLFTRCVSGTRVIPQQQTKKIGHQSFHGFGSSTNNYGDAYLTSACAIGLTEGEMHEFFIRLNRAFLDFVSKRSKTHKKSEKGNEGLGGEKADAEEMLVTESFGGLHLSQS